MWMAPRSVVLLTKAIELAGGAADYHVPHRLKDGYGMRAEVVEAAAAQGVKLIVSVDTGIRAGRSGGAAPTSWASTSSSPIIICPKPRCRPPWPCSIPTGPIAAYPEKNLCGAGVAFKLAQALFAAQGWPAAERGAAWPNRC